MANDLLLLDRLLDGLDLRDSHAPLNLMFGSDTIKRFQCGFLLAFEEKPPG